MNDFNLTLLAIANAILAAIFFWRPRNRSDRTLPVVAEGVALERLEGRSLEKPRRRLPRLLLGGGSALVGASILAFSITYRFVPIGTQVQEPSPSSNFLALKPTAWTDTIHIETFSDTSWFQTPDDDEGYLSEGFTRGCPSGAAGAGAGVCINMDGGNSVSGGRLTAINLKAFLIDSINVSGMWSPPWVHEIVYPPGLGGNGVLNHLLSFSQGNGSAATNSPDRVWIAYLECWEAANGGCGPGISLFPMNNQGTKGLFINPGAGQIIMDWFGTWMLTNNIVDPVTGCTKLVANSMGADTLNLPAVSGSPDNVNCIHVGDTGNQFGEWAERWICWDTSAGNNNATIAFGLGDQIWGYHTGVTAPDISTIRLTTTWGGGGNKSGTHSRWYDHMEVYTGASGSCPSPS